MDLLATVRKEGSRGGRGDFKWSDVQNSSHRENYLGHSLMAPVGRWQKGRDLNWYAKGEGNGGDEDAEQLAARERKEELRRVKEAEQDAMARALGLPVPDRSNANLQEISNKREFDKVLQEAVTSDTNGGGQGVGFTGTQTHTQRSQVLGERIEGNAEGQDRELQYALKEYKRRHGDHHRDRRRRSRSRDRGRQDDRYGRSHEDKTVSRHDYSSRMKERHQRRRSRSRSRSRPRSGSKNKSPPRRERDRRRDRSRSPYRRVRDDARSERKR